MSMWSSLARVWPSMTLRNHSATISSQMGEKHDILKSENGPDVDRALHVAPSSYLGVGTESPSGLPVLDAAETQQLLQSKWGAHLTIHRPSLGVPLLPSTMDNVARELAGRNVITSIADDAAYVTFSLPDGTLRSRELAQRAARVAVAALRLPYDIETTVDVVYVDDPEADAERLLAELGLGPFPKPQLRAVRDDEHGKPAIDLA